MRAANQSTVLTIDDLSEYLKISKSTLYKLAQEGAMPGQKVGRHWRFHRDAVDKWLRNDESNFKSKNRNRHKPR
jgi:excisionase family DNA binding protein